MKKSVLRILVLFLVVAIASCVWFWGYHSRKNLDNVPSRERMVAYLKEKGEDYTSKRIEGYTLEGLRTIWGEPDSSLFGMYGYIWAVGEDFFAVYFDRDGLATNVKLGTREGNS